MALCLYVARAYNIVFIGIYNVVIILTLLNGLGCCKPAPTIPKYPCTKEFEIVF